jgi:hypothetical protein
MNTLTWCRTIGLVFLAAGLAGCMDREQAAVGKWKADGSALGAAIRSAKMKADNPDASTGQIMGAARAVGATTVHLNKDKTAEVLFGGATIKGTWTIDKEAGVVTLNLTSAEGAGGEQPAGEVKGQTWVAYMNDANDRLRLYMAPRDIADSLRKDGNEAPGSILLSKR